MTSTSHDTSRKFPSIIFGFLEESGWGMHQYSADAVDKQMQGEAQQLAIEALGKRDNADVTELGDVLGHMRSRVNPDCFHVFRMVCIPKSVQPSCLIVTLDRATYRRFGFSPFVVSAAGGFAFADEYARAPGLGKCPAASLAEASPWLPAGACRSDLKTKFGPAIAALLAGENVIWEVGGWRSEQLHYVETLFWLLPDDLRSHLTIATYSYGAMGAWKDKAPFLLVRFRNALHLETSAPQIGAEVSDDALRAIDDRMASARGIPAAPRPTGASGVAEYNSSMAEFKCTLDALRDRLARAEEGLRDARSQRGALAANGGDRSWGADGDMVGRLTGLEVIAEKLRRDLEAVRLSSADASAARPVAAGLEKLELRVGEVGRRIDALESHREEMPAPSVSVPRRAPLGLAIVAILFVTVALLLQFYVLPTGIDQSGPDAGNKALTLRIAAVEGRLDKLAGEVGVVGESGDSEGTLAKSIADLETALGSRGGKPSSLYGRWRTLKDSIDKCTQSLSELDPKVKLGEESVPLDQAQARLSERMDRAASETKRLWGVAELARQPKVKLGEESVALDQAQARLSERMTRAAKEAERLWAELAKQPTVKLKSGEKEEDVSLAEAQVRLSKRMSAAAEEAERLWREVVLDSQTGGAIRDLETYAGWMGILRQEVDGLREKLAIKVSVPNYRWYDWDSPSKEKNLEALRNHKEDFPFGVYHSTVAGPNPPSCSAVFVKADVDSTCVFIRFSGGTLAAALPLRIGGWSVSAVGDTLWYRCEWNKNAIGESNDLALLVEGNKGAPIAALRLVGRLGSEGVCVPRCLESVQWFDKPTAPR